jgi:hypothetical protein
MRADSEAVIVPENDFRITVFELFHNFFVLVFLNVLTSILLFRACDFFHLN